ncbi:putative lysophospholipase (lpl) [Fusarium austroafricanum]|uniref:Lysophospholipase n=1 Tax=Fusarium austroafricanum TaxID=2364996 RepID=A0A8H4KLX7_9HYPO|nr:putative lysophospholipase (lpl) [Fusarium austroafricanum]
MRGFLAFAVFSTAIAAPDGSALAVPLEIRALPNSPSGGYAPKVVDCPSSRPKVRLANRLSSSEEDWVRQRRNNTIDALTEFLSRANISGFDAKSFIQKNKNNATGLPNIAIAASGGGYRALMNGAGFISAADSRNNKSGPISGLLQSSTYLAGLSGGGWLVGSIFANNFSSIPDLQAGNSGVWGFDRSIIKGPKHSGISILNTAGYWNDIKDAVDDKAEGWETTITDYWGRALSYQLVNASKGGEAYTFSSIADTSNFKNADTPLPILVADGRAPNEKVISLNATVYEFNPFEFGSWDPTTYGFAPLEFLASNFSNGKIDSKGECVRGFDQIGFVMGTSSSLFNQFLFHNITKMGKDADIPDIVVKAIGGLLKGLDEDNEDIAHYAPNPFFGWNPTSKSVNAKTKNLTLVDGGEDLQNIPLHPLIQPVRGVDIIFAIDSSADTNNWPNGTALRATYDRVGTSIGNGTLFPSIPSAETFINEKLNQRPTLFGCDAKNFTLKDGQVPPPLIFYIPNAPYTFHSNVSTFTMSYTSTERDNIILNAVNGATQGNATIDKEWPTCVACAVMSRSWWKANEKVPDACKTCFDRYCWNGKTNDTAVKSYEPKYIIGGNATADAADNAAAGLSPSWYVSAGVGVAALFALM